MLKDWKEKGGLKRGIVCVSVQGVFSHTQLMTLILGSDFLQWFSFLETSLEGHFQRELYD